MQELQALANIFNITIDIFTHGSRVAEWRETILPMKEAADLAEYREDHFPPMALYHTNDTHFDLLVADSSRLITNGLLGSVKEYKVMQEPGNLQGEEWQTVTRKQGARSAGQCRRQPTPPEGFPCNECDVELESQGLLNAHKYNHEEIRSKPKFYCDDCDMECGSEDNLKIHMKK